MTKLNPGEEMNGGYASLTAGLLARKGEASPATDAEAHEGIDLDFAPQTNAQSPQRWTRPASAQSGNVNVNNDVNEISQTDQSNDQLESKMRFSRPVALGLSRASGSKIVDVEPEAPLRDNTGGDGARPDRAPDPVPGRRPARGRKTQAGLAVRLNARDFVRLILASRKLGSTCQSILCEALECYLDANDIPCVSEAFCEREAARIARIMKNRRRPVSRR